MSTELSILSLSLIVVIFTVFQRYLVILNWGKPNFKAGLRGDASVHFAIIRHLVKFSTSRFIPNYLISPEPLSYPIAFHRYARLFYSLDLYNYYSNTFFNVKDREAVLGHKNVPQCS